MYLYCNAGQKIKLPTVPDAAPHLHPIHLFTTLEEQSRKLNRDQAGKGWFSGMRGIRDG